MQTAGFARRLRIRNSLGALTAGLLASITSSRVGAQVPERLNTSRTSANGNGLRLCATPVFLHEQINVLDQWGRYLGTKLTVPVQFLQRGSYREIVELLLSGAAESAWLCGYPLIQYPERIEALAVPVYNGAPLYRSHLIVSTRDATTAHPADLNNAVFAYSDPLSNSGYLVPRMAMIQRGRHPDRLFRRTFFTYGHRRVIDAVRTGLASAGAVDGYVWDTVAMQNPAAVSGLRVAWRSETFGFPPIVVARHVTGEVRRSLQSTLVGMHQDPVGRAVLKALNLDRFETPVAGLFDSIAKLAHSHSRL